MVIRCARGGGGLPCPDDPGYANMTWPVGGRAVSRDVLAGLNCRTICGEWKGRRSREEDDLDSAVRHDAGPP